MGKVVTAAAVAVAALILIVHYGCAWMAQGRHPFPRPTAPACVSGMVQGRHTFRDREREMCLAASTGKDMEYWIDGYKTTPGCHWRLEHVKCERGSCLYKCVETEVWWRLVGDGGTVTMQKDVRRTNSTLTQEYHFVEMSE